MNGGEEYKVEVSQWYYHENFLKNYHRDNALLSNFLEEGVGNCEAQTKLILSAQYDHHLLLRDPQRLAVQIFKDHIQAVYYDPKHNHKIWNLIDGKKTYGDLQAPLYDPHILLYALLDKEGRAAGFKAEDFLIADSSNTNKPEYSLSTNTILKLPTGKGVHSTSPPPEREAVSNPHRRPELGVKTSGNQDANPKDKEKDYWYNRLHPPGLPLEEVSSEVKDEVMKQFKKQNALGLDLGFVRSSKVIPEAEVWPRVYYFKNSEGLVAYNALDTQDRGATLNFFIQRSKKNLAKFDQDPFLIKLHFLLSNPQAVKDWPREEVLQGVQLLRKLDTIVETLEEVTLGNEERELMREHLTAFHNLVELRKNRKELGMSIILRPNDFLTFLMALPMEKRKAWIPLLAQASNETQISPKDRTQYNSIGPIIALFTENGKRTVLPRLSDADLTKSPPPSLNLQAGIPEKNNTILGFVDVELDSSNGDFTLPREIMVSPSPVLDPESALNPIDLKTFLLLIQPRPTLGSHYNIGTKLHSPWTPEMSREFLRLNHDGRFDETFLRNLDWVVLDSVYSHRLKGGKSEFTWMNPLIHAFEASEKDKFWNIFLNLNNHSSPENKMTKTRAKESFLPKDIHDILLEIKNRRGIDSAQYTSITGVVKQTFDKSVK